MIIDSCPLKGHQIIGELRRYELGFFYRNGSLKGHQIIGELRPVVLTERAILVIERSPDHW